MESKFYEFCIENGYSGTIEINHRSTSDMEFKIRKEKREVTVIVSKSDIDYSREDAFERVCSELFFRMEGYYGAYN